MRRIISHASSTILKPLLLPAIVLIAVFGCNKNDDNDNNNNVPGTNFTQVNLVASDTAQYSGSRTDPTLINGWGIAFSSFSSIWVSAEGTGVSTVYDKNGAQLLPNVTIPGGSPTGQVFNTTENFMLPDAAKALFIFAGDGGIISGWNSGTAAVKLIDNSSTSSYKGIAIAADSGANFLYAANFKTGKIDVFDSSFQATSKSFTDSSLPSGYAPFNIQNIGDQLYVMYAKVGSDGEEEKGAGLGYVDIYNPNGSLVKRFVSQGELNAPWGVAKAPSGFIDSGDAILVGNFGDGRILAYNSNGEFLGALKSGGNDISIDGLWGIGFAPSYATEIDPNFLYFAAGPNDEAKGAFGYIKR
jgi:uncharacterized protein (TIGR03118 family)